MKPERWKGKIKREREEEEEKKSLAYQSRKARSKGRESRRKQEGLEDLIEDEPSDHCPNFLNPSSGDERLVVRMFAFPKLQQFPHQNKARDERMLCSGTLLRWIDPFLFASQTQEKQNKESLMTEIEAYTHLIASSKLLAAFPSLTD